MSSYKNVLSQIGDAARSEITAIEWLEGRLPDDARLQSLFVKGVETFGDADRFGRWLRAPSRVLNKSPLLCLVDGDIESVEGELVRIDHGVFT